MNTSLWIKRDNIREYKFVDTPLPESLATNQILLKITNFAFTANNTTYANLAGDPHYHYWEFFPTGDNAWGKLPVWGFADVIQSAHPDIAVGEHIYGFFPLASHVVIDAGKVYEENFVDMAVHRQELSRVYNRYIRTANAFGFAPEHDYYNALLRPVFITSFLVDDFFADNDFFGSLQVVLSSASSKTAYGTAFLLHHHRPERRDYEVVGLTSPQNVDFVKSLGVYDKVLAYGDVTKLDAGKFTAYVDFAGNGRLRKTIHEHFQNNLHYNAIVGSTHWDKLGTAKGLPGAKPQFFFAPAQAQKRMADWGRELYQANTVQAWQDFMQVAPDWMDIQVKHGKDAVTATYETTLEGKLNPRDGYILSLQS